MKKIIAITIIIALLCAVLAGCNKRVFEYYADYKTAIIKYPNGEVITISVDSFKRYYNRIEIKCVDGTLYMTALENVILISD